MSNRTPTKISSQSPKKKKQVVPLSKKKEEEILARIRVSELHNEEDYRKIIQELKTQNKNLHDDVKVTSQQVLQLIEKTKVQRPQIQRIEKQIDTKKHELQIKYKQFDQYKKQVQDMKARNMDPEVNAKLLKNQDLLKQMDKQMKQLQVTKSQLEGYLKNNNQSMKEYQNSQLPNELQELIRQNKQLKKRTQSQRRKQDETRHEQIKAQQNYIDLKIKARKIEDGEIPTDLKSLKNQIVSEEVILKSTLYKAVQDLKSKKQQIQNKQQKQRIQKTKRRQQLYSSNEQLIAKMRSMQMQKVKLCQQLNKYQALSLQIQQSKKKNKQTLKKQLVNVQVQTDCKQSLLVLRRDYAGIVGKNRFDDRINVLNKNFNTKIFKVIVYENSISLAAIKFSYLDENNNTYETQMTLSETYLKKCKKKAFQVNKTNDFFKLFKAKFDTKLKRITKLEIVSNLNIKSQFGDKKPFQQLSKQQNVYGFDISSTQLPVSMFGSISQSGNDFYLESLGAQIKGFNEKIKI